MFLFSCNGNSIDCLTVVQYRQIGNKKQYFRQKWRLKTDKLKIIIILEPIFSIQPQPYSLRFCSTLNPFK
jgi:hypothetical protein